MTALTVLPGGGGTPVNAELSVLLDDLGDGDERDARRLRIALVSRAGFRPLPPAGRKAIAERLCSRGWTAERIGQALNVSTRQVSRDLEGFSPDAGTSRPEGAARVCGLCGVPHHHPCRILARHLESMRLRGLAEDTTIYDRDRFLRRLARALPVPVLDADAAQLLAWRAGLNVAPGSVGAYAGHVREFFAWAVAQGLRDDNPAAGIPVPKPRKGLPRPVSEDDLMTAVENAPPRVRLWLVLAAWCGLRAKEIALLKVGNILLTARPPVLLVAADATKGSSERVVPLCPFAVSEITAARLPGSGYAFLRMDGRRGPNTPNLVSHLANRHLHACGIADTLHSARHRFGTMTYRASKDIRLVQDLLGHASPATTSLYAAYDKPRAVAVVAALPVPGGLPLS